MYTKKTVTAYVTGAMMLATTGAFAHPLDPAHNFQEAMAGIAGQGVNQCANDVCSTGSAVNGDTATTVNATPSQAAARYRINGETENAMIGFGPGAQVSRLTISGWSDTDASWRDTNSNIAGEGNGLNLADGGLTTGMINIRGGIRGGSRDAANDNQGAFIAGRMTVITAAGAYDVGGPSSGASVLSIAQAAMNGSTQE